MHQEPLTPEEERDLGDVVLVKRDRISVIWLVPLLAALVGLFIVYKSIVEAGIPLTIDFESGEGIEAGKTKILLKGIVVGSVDKVTVKEDLNGVRVAATMDQHTTPILREDTTFWLVQPQISLSGITGLNALVSGNYIAINPGSTELKAKRSFVALSQAPPLGQDTPGLHIILETRELGSISAGTKIFYRKIPVGEVQNFELTGDGAAVRLQVHILDRFAHLVNRNSQFWNSSGIKVSGGLSGIQVETESLTSILSGGISFYTPPGGTGIVRSVNGDQFQLHDSFEAAEAGISARIFFADGIGLTEDSTVVRFNGVKVGKLKKVELNLADTDEDTNAKNIYKDNDKNNKGDSGVWATVVFDPNIEKYLNDNTQFWLVKPKLALTEVKGLDTVITGPYIMMAVGNDDSDSELVSPKLEFSALTQEPTQQINSPGLKLTLTTDDLGSLAIGSKIYYRKIPVGEIEDYNLSENSDGVELKVHIEERFAHLIQKNSRFWNSSGVSISGGLSGIKVRTESLAAIVAGGISFTTPDVAGVKLPSGTTRGQSGKESLALKASLTDGNRFVLYSDFEAAETGVLVSIKFRSGVGLKEDSTEVKLDGVKVGVVKNLAVVDNFSAVNATVLLNPVIATVLNENTQFWLEAPQLSLTEVKGLDTLITGPYINMSIGKKGTKRSEFVALNTAPNRVKSATGLKLQLVTDELGSVDIGSKVFYHQLPVGDVEDYRLLENGKTVGIDISIDDSYARLVNTETRFWNASGISISGGVSGVKIRAESLLSIVAGGIAFDNFSPRVGKASVKGQKFKLYNDRDMANNVGVNITITFDNGDGMGAGTLIKFRGVTIGKVDNVMIKPANDGVTVTASIDNQFSELMRTGNLFWVVRPQFGLTGASDLGTLVSGEYIELELGQGALANHFVGSDQSPLAPKLVDSNDLHIVLKAERLGSVKKGVRVYYREIPVGEIVGYQLSEKADAVNIHVMIKEKYAQLVKQKSRFWNSSGFGVDFSLFKGASFKAESIESVLEGGISFATPNNSKMGKQAVDGDIFELNDKLRDEWLDWQPEIPVPDAPISTNE